MNKWLVSMSAAAAAMAAGGALAVESQNIVGFQDFNGTGTFNLTGATFFPPTTDGSGMTVSNITVNATFLSGNDAISLYTSQGYFTRSLTYYEGDDEIPAGWYEVSDFNNSDLPTVITDEGTPYGSSFVFNRSTGSAAVKYSGELVEGATTLPAPGTFNFVCNAIPVSTNLTALAVNTDFLSGNDAISRYTTQGYFINSLTYYEGDDEIPAGWYEVSDFNNSDLPTVLNSTGLAAGEGFIFNRSTSTARVVVKSPR